MKPYGQFASKVYIFNHRPIWTFLPTQDEIDEIREQERQDRILRMLRKLEQKGFHFSDLKSS